MVAFLENYPDGGPHLQNPLPVDMLEPEDVSAAIAYLASDDAKYVTGVTFPVDAGFCNKLGRQRPKHEAASPARVSSPEQRGGWVEATPRLAEEGADLVLPVDICNPCRRFIRLDAGGPARPPRLVEEQGRRASPTSSTSGMPRHLPPPSPTVSRSQGP